MNTSMKRIDYITTPWSDYELLDCGEGRKLERFGTIVIDRPDPQALWLKTNPSLWKTSTARFIWAQKGERWDIDEDVVKHWTFAYTKAPIAALQMSVGLGSFKHIGVFPEHAAQWQDIAYIAQKSPRMRVLNLFGYTGAASIAAALAGAQVTHVDASKQTIATVKENIRLSGLPSDAVRLLTEDALQYVKRLIKRGEQFEMIIMDPPAFGRGPKGEVWKIEEKLPELIAAIPALLSDDAVTVILNGYAAGYSARSFGELLQSVQMVQGGNIVYGDVGIQQSKSDRVLSTGIYAKWYR